MIEEKDTLGGILLHFTSISVPMGLILISAFNMVVNGLYSYIVPPGWDRAVIHSLSLLGLSSSFLLTYLCMTYLYPLTRLIVSATFTVFYIHNYDFIWSINSQLIRGHGFSVIALLGVVTTLVLLFLFNNKHGFMNVDRVNLGGSTIIFMVVLLGFAYMCVTCFWIPSGVDPNINLGWAMGKFSSFFIGLPLIEVGETKAPLRMDPRVLKW